MKKIIKYFLALLLFFSNTGIIYALEIYENNNYSIYYNDVKSNEKYTVATLGEGDRIFYDLEGVMSIFRSKGSKDTQVFKLGKSLSENNIKESISKLASSLGEKKVKNSPNLISDYSKLKENDNIAITTRINNNLLYGITNEISTDKFIPFAIMKFDTYETKDQNNINYETVLFESVDIGTDVESYIENGKVYYPIRFVSELLGGNIELDYMKKDGDKTKVLVNFDNKDSYELEYIYSNDDDEDNEELSKNSCVDIKVLKDGNEVDKYLYHVDNSTLKLVQKNDLKNFISGKELSLYKSKSDVVSICNTGESIDIYDINLDIFIGSENSDFIPTNLTIKNGELEIESNHEFDVFIDESKKIKNIILNTPDGNLINLDKVFNLKEKTYTTAEEIDGNNENVCFNLTYDDSSVDTKCVYMDPSKTTNKITIGKYKFNILRKIKDSSIELNYVKVRKKGDTDWITLTDDGNSSFKTEGYYKDYEILIEPQKGTTTINSADSTNFRQEGAPYKFEPTANTITFEVIAEDGTKKEYKITFDDSNVKQTIQNLSIIQSNDSIAFTGSDTNNIFNVNDFDKSKGSMVTIKYTISTGEEKQESFTPDSSNLNTFVINIKNNTYKIVFNEIANIPATVPETSNNSNSNNNKEQPTSEAIINPVKCSSDTIINTGTTTTNLNVRNAPSTATGEKITVLKSGASINIVSSKDGWYEIKYPEKDSTSCGFVSQNYVTLLKSDNNNNNNSNNNSNSQTISSAPNSETSDQVRELCLTKDFQKRWKNANENKTKAVKNYLKSSGSSSYIKYSTFGINEFEITNFKNNYQEIQKSLILTLVLERGQNTGGIDYFVKFSNDKDSLIHEPTKFYAYLLGFKNDPKINDKFTVSKTATILYDIEYCINNLVDKTKVGNKVKSYKVEGHINKKYGDVYIYEAMNVIFKKK